MTINEAKTLLVAQHARLRELLAAAQVAAGHFLGGEEAASAFQDAIRALRVALAEHNQTEEDLLVPLFQEAKVVGPPPVALMLQEHAAEHAAFRDRLSHGDAEVAGRMPQIAKDLLAHMAVEERSFLYQTSHRAGASPQS